MAAMCETTAPLADLAEAARQALLAIAHPRSVRRGETVITQGERPDAFFVVRAGRLKMCRGTASGRNLILALAGPGGRVGVSGALSGEVATSSWEAVSDGELLEVRRQDFYALLARRPDLIPALVPWLTRNLVECRNCIVETSCSRVENRFAALFLALAETTGRVADGALRIAQPLSRQELADLTGTTLETAIRVMSRWSREGVVATRPDGFLLLDRPRLEALSWS
jgi:CRP/FNR family transcriptional regulator, nitrogen oxide reductase regulator